MPGSDLIPAGGVLVARVVFTLLYLALTGVPTRLRRRLRPGDTGRSGFPRADDDRTPRMADRGRENSRPVR